MAAGKSAVRLSGFYSRDGGYIDDIQQGSDDVNETDVYGGRADFLWQASEDLSVRLAVYAQKIERGGSIAADYDLTGHDAEHAARTVQSALHGLASLGQDGSFASPDTTRPVSATTRSPRS